MDGYETRTGMSPRLVAERDAKVLALGSCPAWWRPFARRRWRRRRAAIMAMDVSMWAEDLRRWYSIERVRDLAARPAVNYGSGLIARHLGPRRMP
jgi:hypothetical protein